MKRLSQVLVIISFSSFCFSTVFAQNTTTTPKDTLTRELLLEKEYIPQEQRVKKEMFTPLPQRVSGAFMPLSFVRDTYPLSAKYHPKEIKPLENEIFPETFKQKGYINIGGSYPFSYQFEGGFKLNITDQTLLSLKIGHQGHNYNLPFSSEQHASRISAGNLSDFGLVLNTPFRYLPNSVLSLGLDGFLRSQTAHSLLDQGVNEDDKSVSVPSLVAKGLKLQASISDAPLDDISNFYINGRATLFIVNKEELPVLLISPLHKDGDHETVSNLNFSGDINLGYKFSEIFGANIHGHLVYDHISSYLPKLSNQNRFLFATTPGFNYTNDLLKFSIGAKLFNGQSTDKWSLFISPDLNINYQISRQASLYASIKGGNTIPDLFDFAKNQAPIIGISEAFVDNSNLCKYNVNLGSSLGAFSGFSFDVNGGFALYDNLLAYNNLYSQYEEGDRNYSISLVGFQPYGKVKKTYLNLSMQYAGSENLTLNTYFNINVYNGEKEQISVLGLPKYQAAFSSNYFFTSNLSLNAQLNTIAGIKYNTNIGEIQTLPAIIDLNLRANYNFSSKFSVYLSGQNLLNRNNQRWLAYDNRRASVHIGLNLNL